MKKKNSYVGSGINSNDITSKLNQASYAKTLKTVQLNDAYRVYYKTTSTPISFADFKRRKGNINKAS
jgi:hypothetical protein